MAGGDEWQRLPLLVRLKGAFANRSGYPRKSRMDRKTHQNFDLQRHVTFTECPARKCGQRFDRQATDIA
jgi:hypothetical protein